jgi:hypothetical protein
MQDELVRSRALQPYLLPAPSHAIIGQSRFAVRLRRDVVAAARDPSRCANSNAIRACARPQHT